MSHRACSLSDFQIKDSSAYFASLEPCPEMDFARLLSNGGCKIKKPMYGEEAL